MSLIHHVDLSVFECPGCGETIEIPVSARSDPERLVIARECLEADHGACEETVVRKLLESWSYLPKLEP